VLLHRKQINKWAKWVALVLAVVFAVSFVAMGVGSGGGLNWSSLWGGGGGGSAGAQSPEQQIEEWEARLAENPKDTEALLGLANLYGALGRQDLAVSYLEELAVLEPGAGEVHMRLASIYLSPEVQNNQAAVRVLQEATALDPNNADAFLQLGVAERGVGNINGAILAWNRYLELDPDGQMAETVRQQIELMAPKPADSTTTESSPEEAGN
jgi:cytochrome c-type biogenesis protein CcmH/NrfG